MSALLSLLTEVRVVLSEEETGYADEDIRAHATERHMLGAYGNQMLAVLLEGEDGFHVSFVLFEHLSEGSGGKNKLWKRLMDGSGPTGALRECRHTCWGEGDNNGYMFYAPLDAIAQAMGILKKWFD